MDIKVGNLTKIYGTEKSVDSISFNVKPGENIRISWSKLSWKIHSNENNYLLYSSKQW